MGHTLLKYSATLPCEVWGSTELTLKVLEGGWFFLEMRRHVDC
jgi:hypothetical protein